MSVKHLKRKFITLQEYKYDQQNQILLQQCLTSQVIQNQKEDQPYKESQPPRKKYKVDEKDTGMMVFSFVRIIALSKISRN